MTKTILVTGATGKQGKAVIQRLSTSPGVQLIGLTRNAESAGALSLARKYPTLKLISGNLDQVDAIFNAAATPIWGIYSVSPTMISGFNPALEESQGRQIIDAAIAHGVRHFVYSSVDRHGEQSDENETNVPHFQSKHRLEKYLQQQVASTAKSASPMCYTILRLPWFMENLTPDMTGRVAATAWKLGLPATKKMQLISTKDIAFFAERAFNAAAYANESISLAGDALTFDEANELFRKRFGRDVPTTYELAVNIMMKCIGELGIMMRWFGEVGCAADIASLRTVHPGLLSFEAWLKEDDSFPPL